jgi:hypothetical protein
MNLIEPMKLVARMNKDKNVHKMIDTVDVFIVNIGKLLAIFNEDYKGSDFCAGAVFGMNGSDMLIKISQTVISSSAEDHKHKDDGELEVEDAPISKKASLKGKTGKAGKGRN